MNKDIQTQATTPPAIKQETEIISGSEILIRSLLAEGVDTLFGYPGGAIMPVFDALYDHKNEIRHVLVRHEQGAVHAAQGYARVSEKVGVALVTSGPGATNTITGITDAMMDSTPLVVISGQVSSALLGSDAFQEADVIGVTQPITKWAYQVRRVEDLAWAVSRAFYIASSGRPGPVVLDIAKDAQINSCEYSYQKSTFLRSYQPVPDIEKENIKKAAEIINSAKKPLALIGQGVILGNAEEELRTFLEKADIPFGSTILGLSAMQSNHPLNFGMLGMHGNVAPNMMTNECDVLIAIGMRFDDRVTGDLKTYAKQAKVIHFDIDQAELDKNVKTTVKVAGDAKQTLPLVTELLEKRSLSEWISEFNPYVQKEYDCVIQNELYPENGGEIKMGEVINKVTEATDNKAICVTDVGQHQMMSTRYFKYTQSRSMVTSGGLGTMGFGLPAGIGAKYGAPDRTVCIFVGDGGLQMTIQEFGTIMEYDVDVKIILLNNNYLGMVRQWQELFFDERYSETHLKNPDFIKIADAYKIKGRKVTKREELDDAISEMLSHKGAFLLEVVVETKGMVYPMVPAGGCVTNILLGNGQTM
ncbi:MAG: biosynthetic-type acetolactate synthase large subunit [Fermentimonas sp.]|jgi:acetolactate synthase-1/2/3 large subunit|nr:biosynthetic-type acetolactate synthase large subunit [Fermentimonas sp.]NLC85843.1 biosynthetic-type acetolactate synthase large subunit [Bacteroidales bacterium]HBT85519.1 biosynthetic-type acetolactate synthase large subunit [Porphyromonadaceae bacterium]MDD2930893.1 biosynthetic-type acetolactate synthase large subunit [Fermentimonas sp.]MDD3188373.1 biosynthetic-type acetolactate synthase large subunit [Fermentimonas sp.]